MQIILYFSSYLHFIKYISVIFRYFLKIHIFLFLLMSLLIIKNKGVINIPKISDGSIVTFAYDNVFWKNNKNRKKLVQNILFNSQNLMRMEPFFVVY